jgi:hypothetical protein
MNEQMRDFFKFRTLGQLKDVITPIVQVIAASAYSTKRGIPRYHSRQGYAFLGFWGCCLII